MSIGSFVGNLFGVGGPSGASDTLGQSLAAFNDIKPPSIEEQRIKLEEMVRQGQITPEQAQAYMQGDSGLKDIQADPRLKDQQMATLSALKDLSQNGGLSLTDKSKIQGIQDSNAQAERGSREAILQNAQARGIGSSGLSLASQLMNQQGAATRNNQEGLGVAAQGEQRALEALSKSGELAGNIRSQDYGEQAKAAEAQDAINRFNTANKQQVQNTNVQTNNAAQMANLQEKQRVADANTGIRNDATAHNAGLYQTNFKNNLDIAAGKSGAYGKIADSQDAQKQRSDQFAGGLIGVGGALGAAALSDVRAKTNIEDGTPDLKAFLDSLSANKYDYKGPLDDGQKHVSVMAQDLEKTPVGKMAVKEDPNGLKQVDYLELLPAIVASLGHLHKKLEGSNV